MATGQNQIQKIKEMIQQQPHRLLVAVMALLLVIRLALFMIESNPTSDPSVRPTTAKLDATLTTDSEIYKKVNDMVVTWPEFLDSDYMILAKFNMFDPQKVMEESEKEQRASAKYEEAYSAFWQNNIDRAQQLVDEALALRPDHQPAQKLRQQILDKRAGQAESPAPTATPESEPPAPEGGAQTQ
jgi:hypothetical protein